MRNILLAGIFLIAFNNLNAQSFCGSELSTGQKNWLNEYHNNPEKYNASHLTRSGYLVPLSIHIVGDDNGYGYYQTKHLWDLLCELNEKYAPVGFYFYIYGDIQYINNYSYFVHDFSHGLQMMNQYNVTDVVNVYFVDDPAGYCGYFAYGPDAVAVANSCSLPGSTTLAHELGHYFSLPHPFDKVNNVSEYVDGSNCTIGGDLFCDTPADFLNYRWSCPYNGDSTDAHGDKYDPDETLYMSYSYDQCANRFSGEETDAMINNLIFERGYLLEHPTPKTDVITEVPTLVMPVDSADNVSNTFAAFSWTAVPNANLYNLQATKFYNFGYPLQLNVVVSGTAFTTWLLPNEDWVWRVKPMNEGYTCAPYSAKGHFTTVQGTGFISPSNSNEQFSINPSLIDEGNSFSIVAHVEATSTLSIVINNVEGRKIIEEQRNVNAGANVLIINTSSLCRGMYLVTIISQGNQYQQKLMVAE
jgi:hypothetical protein